MDKLFDNLQNFFASCSETDIVMLATLILIPVLAVVLLIVTIVRHAKSNREEEDELLPTESEAVEPVKTETEQVPAVSCVQQAHAPAPAPERVKVKVCKTELKKADKYLLLATGIFCVGLGAMIQRAISGDK